MSRKAIWIPTVPSSGSSCVAGILHELGVSMGRQNHPSWLVTRGYSMWEDPDFRLFSAEYCPEGLKLEIVAQREFRMRDYITHRFIHEPNARIGFKGPAHWFAYDKHPADLPIEILDVSRPLEEAIISDFKTNETRQQRYSKFSGPPSALEARLRAGSLAICWLARAQLFAIIPPTYSVEFSDLTADPETHVREIVAAFDLDADEDQIQAAISTVALYRVHDSLAPPKVRT